MGVNFKICRGDIFTRYFKSCCGNLRNISTFAPLVIKHLRKRGYEIYAKHENDDGDLGVIMRKILIPEQFNDDILGRPPF